MTMTPFGLWMTRSRATKSRATKSPYGCATVKPELPILYAHLRGQCRDILLLLLRVHQQRHKLWTRVLPLRVLPLDRLSAIMCPLFSTTTSSPRALSQALLRHQKHHLLRKPPLHQEEGTLLWHHQSSTLPISVSRPTTFTSPHQRDETLPLSPPGLRLRLPLLLLL